MYIPFSYMELIFKGSEILNFFKICTFLNNGATQVWNAAQQVPYAYLGNEWVGYDNIKSFHIKVRQGKASGADVLGPDSESQEMK